MEQIIVTHLDGSTLKLQSKENGSQITQAKQNVQLLGVDTVDVTVESAVKLNFYIGDKITIIGRDYTLNTPAKERKISENQFVYDVQFEGIQYELLRAAFNVNISTTSNSIQDISGDSLTGNLKRFLDVLISNANRVFPGKWVLGTYPSTTDTRTETFSDTDNCLSVLQSLCSEDKYNTEFNIKILAGGVRELNIGATGKTFTYTFQYGKGKGIYELTRDKVSSANIITRLNVYGGSKNIITSKYRASKLCLPTKTKAQSYLEDATAISNYGVWEYTKNFDEIYPQRVGTVSSLGATELKFIDSSLDFDLNAKDGLGNSLYLIAGTTAKIHFNTGNLAGYEFELSAYDHATKQFTLIPLTDENGYTFPSPTTSAFKIAVGDKYIITDIYLPQSYIDTAEAKLQTEGTAFLAKYSKPRVQYSLNIDKFFLQDIAGEDAASNVIWVGDYIPVIDTDIAVNATIRVTGFTRDLLDDYPSYQLTISDQQVNVTLISRMVGDLKDLDNIVRINNLTDAGRARRNWLASQELLNMVFDTEGDYYSGKIKPLSIETSMLSVGAKSTQFGLMGTIFQTNYGGAKNRIVYAGGTITHYAIVDGSGDPRVWNITDGDVTLGSDSAYYIYVKAQRVGSGASILFSLSKITVDSDGAFFHFLIGVINSVDATNARALALTYGFTTINGRFIRTGRIQSPDGATYFDLDAGEFKGIFKFTNGETIENTITNIQVGGRNLLLDSAAERASSNEYLAVPITDIAIANLGKQVMISFELKTDIAGTIYFYNLGGYKINTDKYISSTTSWVRYIMPVGYFSFNSGDPNGDVCNLSWYGTYGTGVKPHVRNIKVELGNKATDYTQAPEDVAAYADSRPKTVIDGGLITTGRIEVGPGSLGSANAGMVGEGSAGSSIRFWAGDTYANRASAPFRVRQDGSVVMNNATITGTIYSGSGSIGGFSISSSALTASSSGDEMYLNASLLRFTKTSRATTVYLGADVMPGSLGGYVTTPFRIEVARTESPDYGYGNVGIYFNITGVATYDSDVNTGNHAIFVAHGQICGFRPRTRRISSSTTLTDMDSVILCINSGSITITLPVSPQIGQIYVIHRCADGGLTVSAGSNYISSKNSASKVSSVTLGWQSVTVSWDEVNSIWWAWWSVGM